MNKKILLSLMAIGAVVTIAAGATNAFFTDTETSAGNQFTAGVIDLEIDSAGNTVFTARDDPLPEIFKYLPANDIKPGNKGEVTLSLHLKGGSNNANLWMQVLNPLNFGGLNSEPECEKEGGTWDNVTKSCTPGAGVDNDIASEIKVKVWVDEGNVAGWQGKGTDTLEGDNILNGIENTLYDGTLTGLVSAGTAGKLTVKSDAVASTTYYVGFSWELPGTVGNEHQGDYCTFDIKFGADQI